MNTRNNKILIVDDEADIVSILSYNLKKEGYSVESCSNGEEAIEKARISMPDMILLDVMMPVMDGIEACHQMRQMNELNDTIIVFLHFKVRRLFSSSRLRSWRRRLSEQTNSSTFTDFQNQCLV